MNNTIIKMIHPLLLRLMKMQNQHELHIINEVPELKGNAIFAVNHSCRWDMPIVSQLINRHTYVLVGKQRLDIMSRCAFYLNGVVYVDRKDKKSKSNAANVMLELLRKGENLCMYPEGTWNLTPSKPTLPLYWGIIDIARKAKVPILPVVLEYKGIDCYVKFGTPIYVGEKDSKQDKINVLADSMATMKWDIWEMFPRVSRADIDEEEWNREVQKRIMEYSPLDYEYEKSCVRMV